ncbi:MAG: 7-cyano-7-deazaguanine synthase QueC [Fimbriimonadaceae bacterium]
MTKKAVVLLSGGLDSATVLALARRDGWDAYTMSFDYGQRHRVELECAKQIAESQGCEEHRVVQIDLRAFGGSALTSDAIEVPKTPGRQNEIPVTYVPARNTIFLSYALGWAEVLQADRIYAGVNAVDYSGYPDCRPEYIEAYQRMATLATKRGVQGNPIELEVPLIHLNKTDIIRKGLKLGVDYGLTSSCYDPGPNGEPCNECDSCRIRAAAFAEIGTPDPRVERFRS